MKRLILSSAVVGFVVGVTGVVSAEFVTLAYPGALATTANDISGGNVVGTYFDSS